MELQDNSVCKLEEYSKPQLVRLGSIEDLTKTKGSRCSDSSGGRAWIREDPYYSDPNFSQKPGRPMGG